MATNTGCRLVRNKMAGRLLYIIDGEDTRYKLTVGPEGSDDFNGVQLPWCNTDKEVQQKAFLVKVHDTSGLNDWLYIFKDYKTDMPAWALTSSPNPYGSLTAATQTSGYVDVDVDQMADGTPIIQFGKV